MHRVLRPSIESLRPARGRAHCCVAALVAVLLAATSLVSCSERPAEPTPPPAAPPLPPAPTASTQADTGADPKGGKFDLAAATAGLPLGKELLAEIQTDKGTLSCELLADKAPRTVANFVGLARGLRPYKDRSRWVERPAYDGLTFHRVVRGFMIQGGDPTGTGGGEPGYVIPDEVWPGARHDRRGLLCMANRGKNTNGMQFFITDGPAPHLDGGYTIFGVCSPDSTIEALASVEVRGERPVRPPRITKVSIVRQ
jgi:peptidyl-prolyl cis-trans isomerase A (cyclophilin A)